MLKLSTIVLFIFCTLGTKAQNNAEADALIKKCQDITTKADGKKESFAAMIDNGMKGLSIVSESDHKRLCQFSRFIGTGYYNQHLFDSAKKYLDLTYSHSVKAKMGDVSAYALGALLNLSFIKKDIKGDSIAKLLQLILDTTNSNTIKANGYYSLGYYHINKHSFYNIALDEYLHSLAAAKIISDTSSSPIYKVYYSIAAIAIADIYISLKQPEKSLQYLVEAKKYEETSLRTKIGANCRFVKAYVALKQIDSALYYRDQLATILADFPSQWSEWITANLQIGSYYLDNNEPAKARAFIDTASRNAANTKASIMICQVDAVEGKYYLQTGNRVMAKKFFESALGPIHDVDRESYCNVRKGLAEIAIEEGNATEAKKQFALYIASKDSLADEKISNNLAEMEAKYQNVEKKQQLAVQEVQLSFASKQKLWLIGGLVLAGLVALFLLLIYRNKKKTADLLDEKNKALSKLNKDLEEANQTKAKLFSIISHDLRSPISQVYQFLKLQQLDPLMLDEQQKNELSNKIQSATGSLLETMEDLLLWSKTQMSEFKTDIHKVQLLPIVDACKNLLQLNMDAKNIRYNNSIDEKVWATTDPYYLQTIIRNLLQNAVKASPENGEIKIGSDQRQEGLVIYLKNEGGTLTQEKYLQLTSSEGNSQSLNGMGLRLVNELAQKIGATIFYKPSNENGTCVEITLP